MTCGCALWLLYDPGGSHGWSLDLHALRTGITARTRAVVVVHPNNPTGHFTTSSGAGGLSRSAGNTGWR